MVYCVRNGLEAISIICEREFSVIFMDIDMPKMNGLTAAKVIKMKNPTVKIIAHTSRELSEIPDHEKYFDGYIRTHIPHPKT
jgi:CheY-like chemotaxis protein